MPLANIPQLLEEMGNYDKDKRFMAASDLCQTIVNQEQAVDTNLQKKVCNAFLTQLQDQSIDVQGNAVKCLAKMVGRFQEQQIGEVMSKLSQLVVEGKPEVRDIYATCLKGLVAELPMATGTLVCQNVMPRMMAGIASNLPHEVKEECTDVLQDTVKRFGDNRSWWNEQDALCNSLLALMGTAQRPSMRKKATACIGALSAVMSDRSLVSLVRGLLGEVRKAKGKAEKQTYVSCVGMVGRHVGHRIGQFLSEITPLLLQICVESTSTDVSMEGSSDEEHDLVENCLTAFESFVLRCPQQMAPHYDELAPLVLQLISYNPNVYDDGGEADGDGDVDMEEDMDDEGIIDSDDDDSSWKVRRGALKVSAALIHSYSKAAGGREDVYALFTQPLIERFRAENEENVKLDVLNTFAELVRSSVVYSDDPSSRTDADASVFGPSSYDARLHGKMTLRANASVLTSALPHVVTAVCRQLRSKSVKTRAGVLSLVKVLSQALSPQLEASMPKLNDELVKVLKESSSPASMKLDTLIVYHLQLQSFKDAAVYQKIAPSVLPLLLKAIDDSYYKISAQALRVVGAFVYVLRPGILSRSKVFDPPSASVNMVPMFDAVRAKLTAAEVDQEVKECALQAFGHLAAVLGDLPAYQTGYQNGLAPLVERLKNELTRKTAILAIKSICHSPLDIDMSSVLSEVVRLLVTLINHQSRALRQMCLDVLASVLRKYGPQLASSSKDLVDKCIRECVPHLKDSDLHIADLCIQLTTTALDVVPAASYEVIKAVALPAILEVARSPLLQGHTLRSLLGFFGLVVRRPQYLDYKALFTELSNVSCCVKAASSAHAARQVIGTLAKCLATMIVSVEDNGVKEASIIHFVRQMDKGKIAQDNANDLYEVELAVLAVGEAGRSIDLSGLSTVRGEVLALLHSPHDEIRSAAAVALGYATVGAMSSFLGALVDQIQSSAAAADTAGSSKIQIHYLLLTALREVIAQLQVHASDVDMDDAGDNAPSTSTSSKAFAEHLLPHAHKVLPVLEQHADSSEEADRTVVSECLGQLLLVAPEEVTDCLKRLFSSQSAKSRTAATSSIRFAAAKGCDLHLLEPLKTSFMACLSDPDVMVRKACLQSVQAACLAPACSAWLKQSAQQIIELIWPDSLVRPELIREVDLGPFKHKVDDGLALRKAAFAAVQALLQAYRDVPGVASEKIMDFVITGLGDQDDVLVLSCQILSDLCTHNKHAVIAKLPIANDPLDKAVSKCIKQIQLKQEVDRASETLRTLARTLRAMQMVTDQDPAAAAFIEMLGRRKRDPLFQGCWEQCSAKD